MKKYHKKGITLLCLTLLLSLKSILAADENEVNPTEKLFNDLKAFFEKKLKPLKPEFIEVEADSHVEYDMPKKKSKVTIQLSGTQINVTLVNEYETQELEFENVDFAQEQAFIEENYVDKFLGHINQIEGSLKGMFKPIKVGLESLQYQGFFPESKFENVEMVKGGSDDLLAFEMDYSNGDVIMSKDKIVGELIQDNGQYFMRIVTKFFQKSFQLAVVTDSYLETESKKLGKRVLEHLDSMYYLNEDPTSSEQLKTFRFSDYSEQLQNLLKANFKDMADVEVTSDSFSIKIDGTLSASGTVIEDMSNMVMFTVIKVKMEEFEGSEYSVVIPQNSIYSMNAMVDKFMLELMQNLKYAKSKINPEESVGVFA